MSEGAEIGQRLRGLRNEKGLTLRELAARVEERTGTRLAFSYISRLEHGGIARPGVRTLQLLSIGLDIPLATLAQPPAKGTARPEGDAGNDILTAQEKKEIEELIQGALQLTPEGRRYVAALIERIRREEHSSYLEDLRTGLERRAAGREPRSRSKRPPGRGEEP